MTVVGNFKPGTLTEREIEELVDRGGKLHKIKAAGDKAMLELKPIQDALRELAAGQNATFTGKIHTATVEQKPDTICRVVAEEDVEWTVRMAGPHLHELFTLHPSKSKEGNFVTNAMKLLAKRVALKMIERFTGPATPWVRFS